jgi:carbonic anhydrase/acetyltransferase-like protein (isoleucine patch superfamily)
MILKNPAGEYPKISASAYVCESAVITGNVVIGENVFVAPHASIRADEPGSKVIIRNNCNIQDNVTVHSLANATAIIGDFTSLAHGCIVHGPIKVGKNCFIGFNSVVYSSSIGDRCFISHRALVKDVMIPDNRFVEDGWIINRQDYVNKLGKITDELIEFANNVVHTNIMLTKYYSKIKDV